MVNDNKVFYYVDSNITYPNVIPYHPSTIYPEYIFSKNQVSNESNFVYDSIRNLIFRFGLDSDNFGKVHWNPFGSFIKPGMSVLIKPNMVRHFHPLGYGMDCLITHGSVIRVICDYVIIALQGEGKIIIGDAPVQSADFKMLKKLNGTESILDFYKKSNVNVDIELIDFRQTVAVCNSRGLITDTYEQQNVKFVYVDLGNQSYFSDLVNRKYAIADYPYSKMKKYHFDGMHKYLIPQTLLEADVIINIPKPKTHRFAGLTGAMKNFIGVNSQKENLPHHSVGSIFENGDEYPLKSFRKNLISDISNLITILSKNKLYFLSLPLYVFRKLVTASLNKNDGIFKGGWHGNDTIWRTIFDITNIVLYADKLGIIKQTPQRTVFTICDSVVSGDLQGPLEPSPVLSNCFVAGFNLYLVDRFLAKLMKFNVKYLPFLVRCPDKFGFLNDENVIICSNREELQERSIYEFNSPFDFRPAPGWEILKNELV